MISEQAKQRMRDLAARYPVTRSAVMPALYIAQQEEGYITQEALQTVAEAIGLTVDDVESVATFYTMYYQHPPGKKVIKVCTSISCYLRGCDALVKHLEKRLGIKRGETSADGNYTFMTAECLASCGTAPVLQVNDEFVENVTLEIADALVDAWNRELGVISGRNAPVSSSSDGQGGNMKGAEPKSEIRL
ncbi:MAG TPA: NADH-quinone oxidoreductase subunit NuoE [Ktedonobacteraceae bacterium]|nr:NADH-quinone oxidoreductase subunit NuoE [Ktedonobacteraceae bacterium]